jgi:hypothetical protein
MLWHIVIRHARPNESNQGTQEMEHRPYFVFGDLIACAITGAAAGWVAYATIPATWNSMIAMMAGMPLGMLVGIVGGILFTPFFGALEIALPTALAGMLAGSATAMLQAISAMTPWAAVWTGGLAGLLCLAVVYALQAAMHGEAR